MAIRKKKHLHYCASLFVGLILSKYRLGTSASSQDGRIEPDLPSQLKPLFCFHYPKLKDKMFQTVIFKIPDIGQ